ncbi:serine hydrolase [Clostridium sp. MCC353]|uniref:serine hydrolase domain-containing protein n=1 Tax=Clostridium sp. MCC353 TaxID=2592646 RepID=UPI001C020835|nr:serine hydrolase [Clostridium sp. MCC353]MBT9779462.1 serine hydrolase [Clostridium sp. MCC353]
MKKELVRSSPEEEGIDSGLIIDFLNEMEKAGAELHGIMIAVNQKVVFEAYNAPYRADIPHILHSYTKTFTNTAAALAYTNGLIRLEDKVLDYFPQYADGANEYLKALTLRDLITMRSGQERGIGGNEWRPLSTSWVDAYFQVPWVEMPGKRFLYSSGNSYILSAVVQKVTGKTCYEYLQEHLLPEIGIGEFTWQTSPEGICSGGNGISLCVEDMTRLGMLYLNGGKWNGRRLLSPEWVDMALGIKNPVELSEGETEYNFHWEHTGDIWAATGMFGQGSVIIPKLNMVIGMTAADSRYMATKGGLIQKNLVSPMLKRKNEADNGKWEILKNKGFRMTLEGKYRSFPEEKFYESGRHVYRVPDETDGIKKIILEFHENQIIFSMEDHRGLHTVTCGLDHWISSSTSMTGAYLHHQYEMDELKVCAAAYWETKYLLMMEWRYPEMAFCDHVKLEFSHEEIRMKRWVNMNSEAMERPEVKGRK